MGVSKILVHMVALCLIIDIALGSVGNCPIPACPLHSTCVNTKCECIADYYEYSSSVCRWRIQPYAECVEQVGNTNYQQPYTNPCVSNANCQMHSAEFKYTCVCAEGLYGDGKQCTTRKTPTTSCLGNGPSKYQCVDNAMCLQRSSGDFTCQCGAGYSDGTHACEKVNIPLGGACTNRDTCDTARAVCMSKEGKSYCDCTSGYYRDSVGTCSAKVALNGACTMGNGDDQCTDRNSACVLYNGRYECRCIWSDQNSNNDNSYCLSRNAYGNSWNDDWKDDYYDIVIAVSVTFAVCFLIVCIVAIIVVVYKSKYYRSHRQSDGGRRIIVDDKPDQDRNYVFVPDQQQQTVSSKLYSISN